MFNLEKLKDLIRGRISNPDGDSPSFNEGVASALEWVLEEIKTLESGI